MFPRTRPHRSRTIVPHGAFALIGLLALVALLASCTASTVNIESDEATASAPATESTGTEPASSDEPASDDEPSVVESVLDPGEVTAGTAPGPGEASVELLDPGAEPRTALRFEIAASCQDVTTITQTQDASQSVDGLAVPAAGTTGTTIIQETTVAPDEQGYLIQAEITSAQAVAGMNQESSGFTNAYLAPLVGLTTSSVVTRRGFLVPGTSELGGAAALGPAADVIEGLGQTQSPLPVEPVGVGARWQTRSTVESVGLRVETVNDVELVSIRGTMIELAIEGRQEVANGSVMTPVEGASTLVGNWDITSTGTVVIDLATANPLSSTIDAGGLQSFVMDVGGLEQQIDQDVMLSTLITSEPGDGCTGRSS